MGGNDGDTKTAHLFSQQQNGKTTNKIEDGRAGIRTHQRSMTTWEVALGETWSQGRYGPRCFLRCLCGQGIDAFSHECP